MDIGFLITTYNRQESCQRLVDNLQGLGDIVVLNDGCDYKIEGCRQYFNKIHGGKRYYWQTVKKLFTLKGKHKYYIMLPDDFAIRELQINRAIELWESIIDKKKICLNLYADRQGLRCWTNFQPIDKGDVWLTQWVDMCFLCEELFFDTVRIREIVYDWSRKRWVSSGVGALISRQLKRKQYHLYQVKESLVDVQVEHGKSQMHDDKNYSGNCKHPLSKRTFDTRSK